VDNIYAAPILLGDIWKQEYDNLMVVSPDVGGVVRARAWPSAWSATWPSSTSAARRPMCRK
jgi:phosphoribosylpyrophosphate synthetase